MSDTVSVLGAPWLQVSAAVRIGVVVDARRRERESVLRMVEVVLEMCIVVSLNVDWLVGKLVL